MSVIDTALNDNRTAVHDLLAAAERTGPRFTSPWAPGKWSPSQLIEHVARVLEEGAHVVAGAPSKFPTLPAFLRPVLRGLFFNRVLKKGAFIKARTNRPFDPETGPPTGAEARVRLEAALAEFDRACRAKAATGAKVASTSFGQVTVEDYARFQALHTRHHRNQLSERL